MMVNIGLLQKPMWVSGWLISSLMFGFTRVASQNLTRAFKPRRSLCKLENNNCTNANKYSKCSQILERDECESGWKWLNCRRPVVSECYWEADRCTSVSDRNGDDDICPAITNQQDCEDKFWFKTRPTSSASCYWKESEGTSSCAVDRENLEDLDNLDPRVCQDLAHVALIQGVCNESQILTGDTCLAIIARDKVNNGKLKDDIVSGCRTELSCGFGFFSILDKRVRSNLVFFLHYGKKVRKLIGHVSTGDVHLRVCCSERLGLEKPQLYTCFKTPNITHGFATRGQLSERQSGPHVSLLRNIGIKSFL